MPEYTEAFAAFILEARDAFNDLCEQIDRGGVAAGKSATIRITLPAVVVDQIRRDRLAVLSNGGGNG